MEKILRNKTKEVLKECIDYLDGKRPETEKNFIIGRLSMIIELLHEKK